MVRVSLETLIGTQLVKKCHFYCGSSGFVTVSTRNVTGFLSVPENQTLHNVSKLRYSSVFLNSQIIGYTYH
jgi:hypothetical protein